MLKTRGLQLVQVTGELVEWDHVLTGWEIHSTKSEET